MRTRTVLAVLLSGGLLAATALVPGAASAQSSGDALDGYARTAVRSAWNGTAEPALAVPTQWSGSVEGCVPGAPSAAAQEAALDVVNLVRDLVDLPHVRFDPALSASAQRAALIMEAQQDLSHFPPSTWRCWTEEGSAAAGTSSLSLGRPSAASSILHGYLDDPGSNNTFVGHRRYLLDPQQRTMANGQTARANALTVLAPDRAPVTGAPTWLPWPSAGYLPVQAEPEGRWSLSSSLDTDFSAARVEVRGEDGRPLPVRLQPVVDGYGPDTLVWEVTTGHSATGPDRSYAVTVSGIRQGGRELVHSWTTRLFDARQDGPQVTVPQPVTRGAGDPVPTAPASPSAPPTAEPSSAPASAPSSAPSASPSLSTGTPPTASPTPSAAPSGAPSPDVPSGPQGSRYVALQPARLLDTRSGDGAPAGRLAERSTLDLQVTGRGGVPSTGVTAVVLNLTAVASTRSSFITAHPSGSTRPLASSLNLTPGLITPNLAIVPVGPDGRVSLYNDGGTTHLLADVAGYYTG